MHELLDAQLEDARTFARKCLDIVTALKETRRHDWVLAELEEATTNTLEAIEHALDGRHSA